MQQAPEAFAGCSLQVSDSDIVAFALESPRGTHPSNGTSIDSHMLMPLASGDRDKKN